MASALSRKQFSKLRIAVIAPLYYTVPPPKYGGTERVVAFLVQELVRMGHSVTLYGASGCKTAADLIECVPMTLHDAGIAGILSAMQPPYTMQLKRMLAELTNYDVVNIHHGVLPFHVDIFTKPGPYVWTDHTELHVENKGDTLQTLYENANAGITSISNSQRDILSGRKYWLGTIYNGIPKYLLAPITTIKPTYLAFLGRLAPEKGAPEAVHISVLAGKQLKVAAKIEEIHLAYYNANVRPGFEKHNVVYMGEIDDGSKSEFLSGAIALVFPIQWSEPFGLVMIEAMACGTPVIAYNKGAVPEVVEEGVTGFIVDTAEEAAAKVKEAEKLDRKRIRQEFEKRFTSAVMAEQYQELFYRVRDGKAWQDHSEDEDEDEDGDEDENNSKQHACPGHHNCAGTKKNHAGSSGDGCTTDTTDATNTDDLVDSFAQLAAGKDSVPK